MRINLVWQRRYICHRDDANGKYLLLEQDSNPHFLPFWNIKLRAQTCSLKQGAAETGAKWCCSSHDFDSTWVWTHIWKPNTCHLVDYIRWKNNIANVLRGDKMRNIAHRTGFEPRPLSFWASVLTILPPRLPYLTTLPMLTCLCGSLSVRSVQTTTLIPLEL